MAPVSLLLALLPAASGYVLGVQHVSASPVAQRTTPASMAAKGFGKAAPPPPPKPKTAGAAKRDAAGKAFDDLKATGAPEYMVFIRTVDAAGKAFDDLKATGAPEYMVFIRTVDAAGTASDWNPVGGIAVPRSNSEEQALAMAIFNNEDDLLKGAYRAYPKLKVTSDKFEYGYRMREFPDDPIKIADPEATKESDNPLVNWFNQLDNPFNRD